MSAALELLGAVLRAAGAILLGVFAVGYLAGAATVIWLPRLGRWAERRAATTREAPTPVSPAPKPLPKAPQLPRSLH